MMRLLYNYVLWCLKLRSIMPWSVRLISHRKPTQEEFDYPATLDFSMLGIDIGTIVEQKDGE